MSRIPAGNDFDGWVAQLAVAHARQQAKRHLLVSGPAGQLAVRYLPAVQPSDPAVFVLEQSARPPEAERLRSLGLTAREADVLASLAGGLTNKQIATALTMSDGTVRTHLMRIYEALGVNNRVAAALRAQEVMGAAAPRPQSTPNG